ncbi:MAG: VanW family protein [Firmicutes bacterium]|nr:VanW family protein [Bacillota bacterium]
MDRAAAKYIRKHTANILFFAAISAVFALVMVLAAFNASTPEVKAMETGRDSGIKIELYFEKQKFIYTDKYISAGTHIIAEELFMRKINVPYTQKREIMDKSLANGGTYKTAVLFTMPLLENTVDGAIKSINCVPIDSTMSFDPDQKPMFRIVREKAGRRVDEQRLYRDIYSALCNSPQVKIWITPDTLSPQVTTYDNIGLTNLRARYSTGYAYSNENRKHNIRLALQKVNGTVLEAGEEFSFNKTVGKRSETNGFREAKIIVAGKYENGVGGGVCQVSTTVYNAVLLAGLKITDVQNHSLECSYELPSFDAMVNAYSSDLKFKNIQKTPVFIRAYGTDTNAVVEVYGEAMEYVIKRHSDVVYRKETPGSQTVVDTNYKYHSPGATSGETKIVAYPHGEMKSVGYLLYYDQKGFLVKKEKIRENVYCASEGLIAVAP